MCWCRNHNQYKQSPRNAGFNLRLARFLLLLLLLYPLKTIAVSTDNNVLFPLEPPDTSSPRAALRSFMDETEQGLTAFRQGEDAQTILLHFERAESVLNLSQVSPDRMLSVSREAGMLLYEALSRVGLPDYRDIPDAEKVRQQKLTRWVIPHTAIALALIEEGDNADHWLFEPQAVANAGLYYAQVKHIPTRPEYTEGTYEAYVTRPDFSVPGEWADELPAWLNTRIYRNPAWKWLVVLVNVGLALALAVLFGRLANTWNKRVEPEQWYLRLGTPLYALLLVTLPLLLEIFFGNVVGLRFEAMAVFSKLLLILCYIAVIYAIFVLLHYTAESIITSRRSRFLATNTHLIRISFRMLAFVASFVFAIMAMEYLGVRLTPFLAGLGIGGLAIALAARPTLENIIGGFTLFADRPVKVGDFCRFGSEEGTVEEIGLRSTRIRKRDETLLSIPNADFSQMQLENISLRRRRLYHTILGLRYETTPEQIRYVLVKLREMLLGHPKVTSEDMHVRLEGFGDYSIDLRVFAYTRTRDWLEYLAIREDINLRIMDIIGESGTAFAFPSQTAYIARDSGLDCELGARAESRVEQWRDSGELPFPHFTAQRAEAISDRLDYPPEGSFDYEAKSSDKSAAEQKRRSRDGGRNKNDDDAR